MSANLFTPFLCYISAITNASQAVVTFTANHNFTVGEIVSFRVTKPFGMFEINYMRGKVLLTTSNTIAVDIDTTTWTPFTLENLNQSGTTPPCCVPSSSGVPPIQEIPATNIQDCFDNLVE
jgi:hypothetical protein